MSLFYDLVIVAPNFLGKICRKFCYRRVHSVGNEEHSALNST